MTACSHVLIVSIASGPPREVRTSRGEVHGPFRLLAQAEYAARMLRRVDGFAEVASDGRDGRWWVWAAPAGASPAGSDA